jgi:hypothetical protein
MVRLTSSGTGCLYAGNVRLDKLSRKISHGCKSEFILDRVDEFHVADGVRGMLHHCSNTLVVFGSNSSGPWQGNASPNRGSPFRAHLGQIVGPNKGGAATGLTDEPR